MNATYVLAAIDDKISSIRVRIGGPSGKLYTYITRDTFESGDTVVVPIKDGFGLATVEDFHAQARLDQNPGYEYKWVVQKVDLAGWEKLNDLTEQVTLKIKDMQRQKARQAVIQQLEETFGKDGVGSVKTLLLGDAVEAESTRSDA